MSKKLLWCRNGALIGLVIVLADYFLSGRYLPWTDDGIYFNIGRMVGIVVPAALIGLVAGFFADRRNRKTT